MNVDIYFAEISETVNAEIGDLMSLVSVEKQEKLERFHFSIDRKLSLYADLLVRLRIMLLLGLKINEIDFEINEHGKPFLQRHTLFHFNISHTRNAIAVAFSNSEIGVDIEKIKPFNFQISKRFFTSSEQEYIFYHENPDHAFYEIWTKKEAYIKCIGTGLAKPLNSFEVLDDENCISMNVGEYITSYYCNEPMTKPPHLITLTEKELLSSFMKISTF
jgi:4'-phosphopantetheinyl transferase